MKGLRPFPNRFGLEGLIGTRGRQFQRREDAFQQLIGDALREAWRGTLHVSPTAGRDGSIDAFLESGEWTLSPNNDNDCPTPLVIECKDHDDTRTSLRDNVLQGWQTVESRLATQAEAHWPGNYVPWRRARGYLYCVSAGLTSQALRDELTGKISRFFTNLPIDQQPPIERVVVLNWSDLRAWLERLPSRFADRWLGVDLPAIVDHATFMERLVGFRDFLRNERLPFVPPEETDPTHPRRLLECLSARAGEGGVLLVGGGGVGKTRRAIETANLAEDMGWRVLHVLPGEPGVTAEELADVVLAGDGPTLVILDYVDQMPRLDWAALRHQFLADARTRSLSVGLLANARPSVLRYRNPERDSVLQRISLTPGVGQLRGITSAMLDRVAPAAVKKLGRASVVKHCGERPIIALFVARELEQRAQQGTLDSGDLVGLRSGDLLSWLKRRLSEDKLTPTPPLATSVQFLPPLPDPQLMAAAAVLAAAPQAAPSLEAVAERVLGPEYAAQAPRISASLETLGWLERHGDFLASAHDVIADEILERTVADPVSSDCFSITLVRVLEAARTGPRTLGRLATALNRLLEETPARKIFEEGLCEASARWLEAQAASLGIDLAHADPDESAYALGAVLDGPPWAETAIAKWEEMLTPWLTAYGRRIEARHLLYKGLRSVPEGQVDTLAPVAVDWIKHNALQLEASFVIAPLLGRTELREVGITVLPDVTHWLNRFAETFVAEFVLHKLLERDDLDEFGPTAIEFTMRWLRHYGDAKEANFVLRPLLERKDLSKEDVENAVPRAVGWVLRFGCAEEASYLLHSLLGRRDLNEADASATIQHSMKWLERFGDTKDAQYVLGPLVDRKDLSNEDAQKAVRLAMGWLSHLGCTEGASHVLHSLLGRTDLNEADASATIQHSMKWIERFDDTKDAQYVIGPLLGRKDLLENTQPTIRHAMEWLKQFGKTREAGFLFEPLLDRLHTDATAKAAASLALAWLDLFPSITDSEFVLRALSRHPALDRQARRHWMRLALCRLRELRTIADACHLLKDAIRSCNPSEGAALELTEMALKWLSANPDSSDADYVFNPLLRRADLPDSDWRRAAEFAFSWLKHAHPKTNPEYTFSSLLYRPELLSPAEQTQLCDQSLCWLVSRWQPDKASMKLLQWLLDALGNTDRAVDLRLAQKCIEATTAHFQANGKRDNFTEYLWKLAHTPSDRVDYEILSGVLILSRACLAIHRPTNAALIVTSLLPLAHNSGDPGLQNAVGALAKDVLAHPQLRDTERQRLIKGSWHLLSVGGWCDPEAGSRILVELGLLKQ